MLPVLLGIRTMKKQLHRARVIDRITISGNSLKLILNIKMVERILLCLTM